MTDQNLTSLTNKTLSYLLVVKTYADRYRVQILKKVDQRSPGLESGAVAVVFTSWQSTALVI